MTPPSLILHVASRFLLPLVLLFSLVVLVRGHNEPGGGFTGGLIAVVALVLDALAHGTAATRRLLRVDPRTVIGAGLLTAVASGLAAWLFGEPFLSGAWLGGSSWLPEGIALGTPVLFDAGVYLVVVGMAMLIILTLAEE